MEDTISAEKVREAKEAEPSARQGAEKKETPAECPMDLTVKQEHKKVDSSSS
jgi:hypothetical protein